MNGEESLAVATAEWRRKYNIADGDPMIAMLDLVRIYIRHAREIDDDPDSPPSKVWSSSTTSATVTAFFSSIPKSKRKALLHLQKITYKLTESDPIFATPQRRVIVNDPCLSVSRGESGSLRARSPGAYVQKEL
jgi:hypothetical protein